MLDMIRERRSVRAYEAKKIPEDIIKAVIESGNHAPSGMNSQPWRFVVVQESGLRRRLLETAMPNVKKMLEHVKRSNPERHEAIMKRFEAMEDPIYYSAPAIIFVIGRGNYAELSCPLACENMMLAAFSLGLGSCWVHFGSLVTDSLEITEEVLELKDDEKIFGPIVFGYPMTKTEPPEKKPPVIKWI